MANNLIVLNGEHGNIESALGYVNNFSFPKHYKVLDIGCGYGSLIYNLYRQGYKEVKGLDISEEFVKKGKTAYPEISDDIDCYDGKKVPYSNESFDVVLMFDVIEHIQDIRIFMEEVYRVLKKGGVFVFQTPNKPMNILWVYINNRSFKIDWQEGHCSLQTTWSLRNLLSRIGFRGLRIEKYNILTEHNKVKVKRKLGRLGLLLLTLVSFFPVWVSTNLWGFCKKPINK